MFWRGARFVLSFALAAYGLYVVYGKHDELVGASTYFNHLRWEWLAVAAVVEAISWTAFAALQRRLLRAGAVRIRLRTMTAVIVAANSIQNSLPAGPVFSNVYAFRQYRARGADDVLAGWVLVGTAALAQITLVVLAGIGLAGATGTGTGLNLAGVIVGLLLLAGLVILAWSRRDWIAYRLAGPLRLFQRFFKRPKGSVPEQLDRLVQRLHVITPTPGDWVMATSYALATWVFDVSCLIAAFLAVGAPVPWRALLLAYAAAQLAANLPITPGGLGVVEGSLTIGLVVFGGGQESTVAAVVLYRLLNFWIMLPIGWTAWGATNWQLRRWRERAPTATMANAEGAT
ncbi:MAG: lysylphosphatidylglycerol synthase transmembrane domain-containing protein [Acidimicrobiales bacterium]